MIGLLFGSCLGSLAGLVSGCFTGLTYRAVHDVSYGNSGPLSFLGNTSSPSDFALHHALISIIPFAVWGGLVGWFQLRPACQSCNGVGSTILYPIGGLIIGAINGAAATPGQKYLVSQFLEGPAAGAIFGFALAISSWMVFRNVINRISRWSAERQTSLLLKSLAAVSCSVLIPCVMVRFLGCGDHSIQLVAQLLVLCAFTGLCVIIWLMRRHCRTATQ